MRGPWPERVPSLVKLWVATLIALSGFIKVLLDDTDVVLLVAGAFTIASALVSSLYIVSARRPGLIEESQAVSRYTKTQRGYAVVLGLVALAGAGVLLRSAPARRVSKTILESPLRVDRVLVGHRKASAVVEIILYNAGATEALVTDVSLDIQAVTSPGTCLAFVKPAEYALADRITVFSGDSGQVTFEGAVERRDSTRTSFPIRGNLSRAGCPDRAQMLLSLATAVPARSHTSLVLVIPDTVKAVRLPAFTGSPVILGGLLKVKRHELRVAVQFLGEVAPAVYSSGMLWPKSSR